MGACVLGLDIGGTNIRAGLVDDRYAVTHFEKTSSREVFGDEGLDGLCAYIRRFIDRSGVRPACISAGFPATVDREHRRVMNTPNLPYLNNLPAADILEDRLGIPAVLNKDTNLLLLHDVHALALDTTGKLIAGVYLGTGIGNAILYDGVILEGKNGAAGELGHIPLPGSDAACGCGRAGCSEAVCGGAALERLAAARFADTPIREVFLRHDGHPALEEWLETLACVVAAEMVILDPDQTILGGGLPYMPGFPRERLIRRILAHGRSSVSPENIDFRFPDRPDADRQGVAGAGIYAMTR